MASAITITLLRMPAMPGLLLVENSMLAWNKRQGNSERAGVYRSCIAPISHELETASNA
jgi:hypothetical protein